MTTDLHSILAKLGLAQYIEKFDDEGFETWETVLDITESDLDALGVKLGHRRVLQREIACYRGVPIELVTSPHRLRPLEDGVGDGNKGEQKSSTGAGGKRKYRRHPKPDEHAPERPPSAYVIFSNKIRGELKPENLSFTIIAKKVGERWQDLHAEEKEPYEVEASSAKERYHSEMANYKTTKAYREYQQYLVEFKAKNTSSSEEKRLRMAKEETQESTTSSGSGTTAHADMSDSLPGTAEIRRRRADSLSSTGPYSTTSGYPSPASAMSGPPALRTAIASYIPLGTVSPMSTSPMASSVRSETSIGPLVRQSIEPRSARTPPGLGQSLPHISQFDNRDAQSLSTDASSQGSLDPRLPLGRTSPFDRHRRPTQVPLSIQQQNMPGTSSKSSINSSLSSGSTAPSSTLPSVGLDEGKRTAYSLPPLASVTTASSLSDSASYIQQSSRSPFLASTDIPRERSSLQNMTLKQNLPTLSGPPEPRHPPHRPALPTLDNQQRSNSQENILPPNADPLSVLAYAGRLVGQESHRAPSQ